MLQIKVYLNPDGAKIIPDSLFGELEIHLTSTLETVFKIGERNDVSFDVLHVIYSCNESPVQIDVLYIAGGDGYRTGEIFDPSPQLRHTAAIELLAIFKTFLKKNRLPKIQPSIWIRPQYGSVFYPGKVE